METQPRNNPRNSTNPITLSPSFISICLLIHAVTAPLLVWGIYGVIASFFEYPLICFTLSLCCVLAKYYSDICVELENNSNRPQFAQRPGSEEVQIVQRFTASESGNSIRLNNTSKSRSRRSSASRGVVLVNNNNESERQIYGENFCINSNFEVNPMMMSPVPAPMNTIFPLCDPQWTNAPERLALNNSNNETPLALSQSEEKEHVVIKTELGPLIDQFKLIKPTTEGASLTSGQNETSFGIEERPLSFGARTTSTIFKALGKFEDFLHGLDIGRKNNSSSSNSS